MLRSVFRSPARRAGSGVLLLCALLQSGCASMGRTGSVTVDAAAIHYTTRGVGSPTVVFDAGAGDDMTSWKSVVNIVSDRTEIFAFDRPGYGGHFGRGKKFDSDADGRRTSDEVAAHLHSALQLAGLAPPYVLVGHSLGGLNVLAFAKMFPADVRGVVLVDGRPPGFSDACRAAGVSGFIPPSALMYLMPEQMRLEARGSEDSEHFADDPSAYGEIPITVLAATRVASPLSGEKGQKFWVQKQREFAASLRNGRFVEVDSKHYIHQEQPALVVSEILRIIRF